MKVVVTSNVNEFGRFVAHVFSDQLPFAESAAINDSARAAQKIQQAHQRAVFTVRRKGWVDRSVKIKPFATKQSPEARMTVDPPGGSKRADIIAQHEADVRKTSIRSGAIAVPTVNVRRTAAGIVKKAERPRALMLREQSGKRQRRGRRRGTFRRDSTIFERTPEGGIRALYQLVPSVPLDRRLKFIDNITRSVLKTYPANFTKRFDQAIATAKVGGFGGFGGGGGHHH